MSKALGRCWTLRIRNQFPLFPPRGVNPCHFAPIPNIIRKVSRSFEAIVSRVFEGILWVQVKWNESERHPCPVRSNLRPRDSWTVVPKEAHAESRAIGRWHIFQRRWMIFKDGTLSIDLCVYPTGYFCIEFLRNQREHVRFHVHCARLITNFVTVSHRNPPVIVHFLLSSMINASRCELFPWPQRLDRRFTSQNQSLCIFR